MEKSRSKSKNYKLHTSAFINNFPKNLSEIHPVAGKKCTTVPRRNQIQRSQNPRVVLYSHDTVGLGHVRRNMLIAQVFSLSNLQPEILLVSGAVEAGYYEMSPGVDCLILPSIYKELDGKYRSRHLRIPLNKLISFRSKMIETALREFEPDVFIVDNVPRGAGNELDSTLEYLYAQGKCHCVFGMRDVLDESSVIQKEWKMRRNYEAIRKYYEEIWVYGDAFVYDAVQEYGFAPNIACKVRYVGYLDQRTRFTWISQEKCDDSLMKFELPKGPYVLCLLGGGQDGIRLAEIFVTAKLPQGISGILVTGPHMSLRSRQRLRRQTEENRQFKIIDFVPETNILLQRAECVISMGGYNALCEIMSFEKKALIIPRVKPRKEQLIRSQRLQALGLVDMIHPDRLKPNMLTEWITRNMGFSNEKVHKRLDMNGCERLNQLIENLVIANRDKNQG